MALMLKNARLLDPQVGLDEVADILIRDGRIVEIGHDLEMPKGIERDLTGKIVVPGLVDMHVHLRDPGFEYKGDIHIMSPLTLESSEFGNLLNPQDKDMVDLLVNL